MLLQITTFLATEIYKINGKFIRSCLCVNCHITRVLGLIFLVCDSYSVIIRHRYVDAINGKKYKDVRNRKMWKKVLYRVEKSQFCRVIAHEF